MTVYDFVCLMDFAEIKIFPKTGCVFLEGTFENKEVLEEVKNLYQRFNNDGWVKKTKYPIDFTTGTTLEIYPSCDLVAAKRKKH